MSATSESKNSTAGRKLSRVTRVGAGIVVIILTGFLIPEHLIVPVDAATYSDWNEDTYWYEPWGKSGVHKGIDIFASKGTGVRAATSGLVVFQGNNDLGGTIALILGPKWRLHYYAHMDTAIVSVGDLVSSGDKIGFVGNSGNASGKQSHLHYVILSVIPYPWRFDAATQGWKKMFYLDPNTKLREELGI